MFCIKDRIITFAFLFKTEVLFVGLGLRSGILGVYTYVFFVTSVIARGTALGFSPFNGINSVWQSTDLFVGLAVTP